MQKRDWSHDWAYRRRGLPAEVPAGRLDVRLRPPRQGIYQTLTQVALTAGVVRPDQRGPKDVDPDSNFLKVANIRVILLLGV